MCVHYILRALRVGLHLTRTYTPRRKVKCDTPSLLRFVFFGGGGALSPKNIMPKLVGNRSRESFLR